MNNVRAYGMSTTAYPNMAGRPVDHVFAVGDDAFNWPCFGRGRECITQAHLVAQGEAQASWLDILNGTDPIHPTGLTNKVDGICHNVANRLIASAGLDVSSAAGNILVTIAYGRFGFNCDNYVKRIKEAVDTLRVNSSDELPTDAGASLIAAIETRHESEYRQIQTYIEGCCRTPGTLTLNVQALSDFSRNELKDVYADFAAIRERTFAELFASADSALLHCPASDDPKTMAFQTEYLKQLEQQVLAHFPTQHFVDIVGATPQEAFAHLLAKP